MSAPYKITKLLDPEIFAKNVKALHWKAREQYWLITGQDMPDPIFILGCSRSGTTVTYETISSAPGLIKLGYEMIVFWDRVYGVRHNLWESEAAYAKDASPRHRDLLFAHVFARIGKGRLVDKTCINALRGTYLYKLFPDAKFVYIQRDGRDNISSMLNGWQPEQGFGLNQYLGVPPEEIAIDNGASDEWCYFYPPGWRAYNHSSREEVCAFQWMSANQHCLDARRSIPEDQWIHLRYEDLFTHPQEVFKEVFEKLDIPFTSELQARCKKLDKYPANIIKGKPEIGKWRKHNPQAIERIMDKIRPMQRLLGYDCDAGS